MSRLAPSPTGVLHLGNARTFLLNWLVIRARAGTLLMRSEDIDGPRVKPSAEQAALFDLQWLGLDWDGPVMRQSERLAQYRCAVDRLLAAGLAYPCVCTRRDVEQNAASAPHESWQDAPAYPGTCRGLYRDLEAAREASGREPAVRFRVESDAIEFDDIFRGAEPGRIRGDFVIQKRDGGPAYQLAVIVDDAATGVNEVWRGDDLVASTPRQILLYRALGLDEPRFAHLPLLVGTDGRRLAKRHGDTSLRFFREAGVGADQIVGFLAWRSGLQKDASPCRPEALLAGFDLGRVSVEPVVIDASRGSLLGS